MTAPTGSKRPTAWDDERLQAAFAARTSTVAVPADLVAVTLERLHATEPRRPRAGRLLPLVATLVLAVGAVGGGFALLSGPGGLTGSLVTFRDGPTAELRTLDAGTFALDFPADWLAYATDGAVASGGSIIAILTTQPIEDRCEGAAGADVNCAYEQRLDPGATRVFVGTGMYRGSTIFDRAPIENGSTLRLTVGGMPAILDEFDVTPDGYYLADQSATWQIALPTSLSSVVRLEFMARDPDADAARVAVDEIAASFRFTPPPTPLPADLEQGVSLGRAMLDAQAASFRQGFVRPDDVDGVTYLDCLPPTTGEDRVVLVQYGPGGDLGWNVLVRCRWMVSADDEGPFWRIDAVYEWTAGETFGRYRESYWMDATGAAVATSSGGEVPPARDPTATPAPTPTPTPIVPVWGPWPPAGAEVIELKNDDPNKPARVAVVDLSGELVKVRASTAQDGQLDGPDEGLLRDPSGEVRYRLRWGSAICDRAMTVTIDAEVERIVVDHAPRDGCDAMGIGRELVLEFSRDIDPASVLYVHNRAVVLPEPPLEPTVAIVDIVRAGTTDRIVVTDHAGSLMEARPAAFSDVPIEVQMATGVRLARLEDGGTVVMWDGAMCDSAFSISIEADDPGPPDRITVRNVEAAACHSALIRRAVWLDLGPVNVDSIELRHDVTVASIGP